MLFCLLVSISVSVALQPAGSPAQGRSGSGMPDASSIASRLPANYRQVLAEFVRTHDHGTSFAMRRFQSLT
jgi:hypothetical protein